MKRVPRGMFTKQQGPFRAAEPSGRMRTAAGKRLYRRAVPETRCVRPPRSQGGARGAGLVSATRATTPSAGWNHAPCFRLMPAAHRASQRKPPFGHHLEPGRRGVRSPGAERKRPVGQARPGVGMSRRISDYPSIWSTPCGSALAWASIAVPTCTRIWYFEYCVVS